MQETEKAVKNAKPGSLAEEVERLVTSMASGDASSSKADEVRASATATHIIIISFPALSPPLFFSIPPSVSLVVVHGMPHILCSHFN